MNEYIEYLSNFFPFITRSDHTVDAVLSMPL